MLNLNLCAFGHSIFRTVTHGLLVSTAMIGGVECVAQTYRAIGSSMTYDAGERCAVPFWATADMNGDGLPDFVIANTPISAYSANAVRGEIMVWLADADGTYRERARQLFSGPVTAGYLLAQVRVADFNGDGIPDILLADSGVDTYVIGLPVGPWPGQTPLLALSSPAGWVDASARFAGLTPTFSHSADVADVNGDGKPDIYISSISAGSDSKMSYILRNEGGGNFSYTQSILPPDVVRDGYPPITVLDENTRTGSAQQFTGSLFVDVNRDGAPDLVLMPNNSTEAGLLLLNDGYGDFSKTAPIKMPPGLWGRGGVSWRRLPSGGFGYTQLRGTVSLDIRAVDLNNDGYPDLAVLQTVVDENTSDYTQYRGGRIQILINQQGRGFVDETSGRGNPGFTTGVNYDSYHGTLSVFDVNGDGYPDLVALRVMGSGYESHVFLNDGQGRFSRANAIDGLPLDGLLIPVAGGEGKTLRIVSMKIVNKPNGPPYGCTLVVRAYEKAATSILTEYFYAPLSYYFITSRTGDKMLLDGSAGWSRTGGSIKTLPTATPGTTAINRYYFDQVARQQSRGSHFYTLVDAERTALAALNPGNTRLPGKPFDEGTDSYAYLPVKEGVGGSCAAGQAPVYRAFRGNTKFPDDPNHRFTTDLVLYNQLLAQGWDGEGVKFCTPP